MHNENIKMCFLLFAFIEFAYQPLNKNVWALFSAAFAKDILEISYGEVVDKASGK
jgi:hypothetical protein